MIINKSCAFQLPFTVEMQKNIFWRSKKSANRLRSFAIFSELPRKIAKVLVRRIAPKKNGPSSEGPLESVDDITLVRVV
jgi:hypothetical protein